MLHDKKLDAFAFLACKKYCKVHESWYSRRCCNCSSFDEWIKVWKWCVKLLELKFVELVVCLDTHESNGSSEPISHQGRPVELLIYHGSLDQTLISNCEVPKIISHEE